MKNSKDYLKTVLDQKVLILAVAIVVAILSFAIPYALPERTISETTFIVTAVNRQQSEDFQYDNYYAIQAAELVSGTVETLLESPNVVKQAYLNAGLREEDDAYAIAKDVKSNQETSHLISLKVTDDSRDGASQAVDALFVEAEKQVENLEATADGRSAFQLEKGEKTFVSNKKSPILMTGIGLIAGLFLGFALTFLRVYLTDDEK